MIEKSNNLSLVIPCYNEQDNLPLLFKKLLEIQAKFNEIILVDNGSTDNTSFIIELTNDKIQDYYFESKEELENH